MLNTYKRWLSLKSSVVRSYFLWRCYRNTSMHLLKTYIFYSPVNSVLFWYIVELPWVDGWNFFIYLQIYYSVRVLRISAPTVVCKRTSLSWITYLIIIWHDILTVNVQHFIFIFCGPYTVDCHGTVQESV